MFKKIRVALTERVVVFRDGIPKRVLGPGKHTLWGGGISTETYYTNLIEFNAPAEVRAIIPADWFTEVALGPRQRGILGRDGRPVSFLRPGVHRFWTVDPTVELTVLSVDEPVPPLSDELIELIPQGELVNIIVNQHQRGLLYVQGKFEQLLSPGRHAFWSHPEAKVVIQLLDMRIQQLTIPGQELMTRDKVSLRLTLSLEHAPADPPTLIHSVANLDDSLYLMAQLAARDYVAGVTLDELLEGRDAMNAYMAAQVVPKAIELGVSIHGVGVKDVVLPGDMKLLLNQVIEADKKAAANVIMRREEASATRQMASTAKVMADNPVLLELKKLEALKDMASNVGELKLNVGNDRLEKLFGTKLLDTNAEG